MKLKKYVAEDMRKRNPDQQLLLADWDNIDRIVPLLSLWNDATATACADSFPTLSMTFLTFRGLKNINVLT